MQAESLAVTYEGGIRALADVGFQIAAGQFVSVVGPSGCGKSTLLRLIAGLISPSEGTLTVRGESPMAARDSTRLSFVFQDPTLLPWRSVRDNVRLPLELRGVHNSDEQTRVADALRLVGLADFSARYPNELSGGMRMRASLARALVTEPDLLLLDEPFGALDDLTRQLLNEELMHLWSTRRWTGIFVTHNIAEAVYLSQRVLVMGPRPGRIVGDIAIPLPTPRTARMRAEAQFATLTGQVSECLRRAAT